MTIDTQRLVEIFTDLVRIDAVSKAEKPVADYLRVFFQKLNLAVIEDEAGRLVGGNSGNIIVPLANGADGPSAFAFCAHMDTVKSTQKLKPMVTADRISSDGNTILGADNRAGIAIILYIAEYLVSRKLPHQPFEAVFTIGEETGLYGSSNLQLEKLNAKTAYILDSSADPGFFVYAAPGAVDFEIIFQGKGSHAAVMPEEGINALSMASALIDAFPVGKVDEDTTINFGKIRGGEANNVVPPEIRLTGEIRSFHEKNIQYYREKLVAVSKTVTDKFGGKIVFHWEDAFPGFVLDRNETAIRYLENSMRGVGLTPKAIRYYGGSDANILNNRGVMAIDLGIGAKNPHSNSEYILIRDLAKMAELVFRLVAKN